MLSNLNNFPGSEFHSSIVIKKTPNGFHTGVIYRDSDTDSINILHLAFHVDLRNDNFFKIEVDQENLWTFSDFWIIPIDFDSSFQRSLSAYCSNIMERNKLFVDSSIDKRIRYGLFSGDSLFIEDGTLILGENCSGLSCSSFVIAVFKSIGIKLVDMSKWPKRESDIETHKQLLSWLKGHCEAPGHMEHYYTVEKEAGCARVRPSEVTASLRFENKPAEFFPISQLGEEIEKLVTTDNGI